MLISDIAEKYLEDREKKLRPNTLEGYRSSIERHIVPDLGGYDAETLTVSTLQKWVDSFTQSGAAEKAYKTLRQMIRWGIRNLGLSMADPTQVGVELPHKSSYVPEVLTREETLRLLKGIEGQTWEAVVALGVLCGLRRCESCGLKWEDIDPETGEIYISRGRHVVKGEVIVLPPKTKKSVGVVYVPSFWMSRLRELHKGTGWVCFSSPTRISQQFQKYCIRYGLPWVPLKNLRHSWATQAIERGVPIEDVMLYLRHTNLDTSYEHYIVRTGFLAKRIAAKFEQ